MKIKRLLKLEGYTGSENMGQQKENLLQLLHDEKIHIKQAHT
jgi:hypothetical protein